MKFHKRLFKEKIKPLVLFLKKSSKFNNKRGISTRNFAVSVTKLGHEDEITPIDGMLFGTPLSQLISKVNPCFLLAGAEPSL
jgi:hypothetical protein